MKEEILNYLKETAKYWWTSLLVGIVAIGLGVWYMFIPGETLIALSIVFVTGFFLTGITDIFFALANRKNYPGWGWTLAAGI